MAKFSRAQASKHNWDSDRVPRGCISQTGGAPMGKLGMCNILTLVAAGITLPRVVFCTGPQKIVDSETIDSRKRCNLEKKH